MGCQIGALRLLIVVPNVIFFAGACYLVYVGGSKLNEVDQILDGVVNCTHTGNSKVCPKGAEGKKIGEVLSSCDTFFDDAELKNDCKEWNTFYSILRYTFIFIIAVGILECITTFLGACGALADKRKMLKLYAGILLFMILLQIAAAVLLFVYHKNPENIPKELKINGVPYQIVALDYFGGGVTNFRTQGIVVTVSALVNIIMALGACFLSTKIHEG